jgi:periplasmic protein TonB
MWLWAQSVEPGPLRPRPKKKIEVAVVTKRAEPKVEPPPPEVKPEKEKAKPKPKPVPVAKIEEKLPPPPNQEPPPTPEVAPPPVFIAGISMSSTSDQGSFKVGVGNTLHGKPEEKGAKPEEMKPYKAERYAPQHLVNEPPVFLDNVGDAEMRRHYPEAARKDEVEGDVRTRLTIDDDGSVVKVVVLSHPGHGFDEAARKLARLYHFTPAKVDGVAVATEVVFTIRFELH